jgi:uncharacterized protein with PIN domain
VSATTYVEAAIAVDNHGDAATRREFDRSIPSAGIEIAAVDAAQADLAPILFT